jgi:hypothetical protein
MRIPRIKPTAGMTIHDLNLAGQALCLYPNEGCRGAYMGLRFRRSWNVLPGVRFNLGLKSGSVSFGSRGFHYTVGTSGSRITVGLPGTGLFWTQKLGSPPASSAPAQTNQTQPYNRPFGIGSPPSGGQPGRAPISAPTRSAPQRSQPPPSAVPSPVISAGGRSLMTTHAHVIVPTWLIWSVLAVIGIGALCLGAASLGALVN